MNFIFLFLLSLSFSLLIAQPVSPDLSFGNDGVFRLNFPGFSAYASNLVIQADDKIIVGGGFITDSADEVFGWIRLHPDGRLDSSLNGNGIVSSLVGTRGSSSNIALQNDGKVVLAGNSDDGTSFNFTIIRYHPDGALDSSFAGDGVLITDVSSTQTERLTDMILQSDGKILAGGFVRMGSKDNIVIIRYLTDGSPDSSFGENGILVIDLFQSNNTLLSLLAQPDGKILAAGRTAIDSVPSVDLFVMRYLPNGVPDSTFGQFGYVTTSMVSSSSLGSFDQIEAMALQPDGKIVAVGYGGLPGRALLLRLLPDGRPDSTFADRGLILAELDSMESERLISVLIQNDGKIIVGGFLDNYSISGSPIFARLLENGSMDSTFGIDGIVLPDFYMPGAVITSVNLQGDGKLLVTGVGWDSTYTDMLVARYLTDLNIGILDFFTDDRVVLVYPNPVAHQMTLEYFLERKERVSIALFDTYGKLIHTFVQNEIRNQGQVKELLELNNQIPTGRYLLRISNPNQSYSIHILKH